MFTLILMYSAFTTNWPWSKVLAQRVVTTQDGQAIMLPGNLYLDVVLQDETEPD